MVKSRMKHGGRLYVLAVASGFALLGTLLATPCVYGEDPISPPSSLLSHLDFEEEGSIAFDSSGNEHDATLAVATQRTEGRVGQGLSLTGVDSGATMPSSRVFEECQELTLAAWIRHESSSEFRPIFDKRETATSGFDLYLDPSSSLFMRINETTLVGENDLADGAWHHVAGTFAGGVMNLYVDGLLEASAVVGAQQLASTADLELGRHFQSEEITFLGSLDEARVYSQALSAAEIEALYLSAPPEADEHPPLRLGAVPLGALPPGTLETSLALETDEAAECRYSSSDAVTYAEMTALETTGGHLHHQQVSGLGEQTWYSFFVRCADSAGNINVDSLPIRFFVASAESFPGLVGSWPLDDGLGTTAVDVSVFEHHGVVDAEWTGGGGLWTGSDSNRGALSFDGIDDLIRVEDAGSSAPLDLQDQLTLMLWVRPQPFRHHRVQSLISKDESYELEIGHAEESAYSLRLNNERQGRGETPLRVGVWQHLAVSWDGETVRYYYDGKQDGSAELAGSLNSTDIDLGIGARPPTFQGGGPSNAFWGMLDEVRVFDRALSEGDIRAAYEVNLSPQPKLALLEPNGLGDPAVTNCSITWADADPDHDATISLYYDLDDQEGGGTLIAGGIRENDELDRYEWNVSSMPQGGYYIYAVIDDGEHSPETTYSPGPVMVRVQTEIVDIPSLTQMLSGEPATCHAQTDPPGFEEYITWAADTMYGMGGTVTPETGRGSSFTATWDLAVNEETNTYWYGIQANEASVQDDPPIPPTGCCIVCVPNGFACGNNVTGCGDGPLNPGETADFFPGESCGSPPCTCP